MRQVGKTQTFHQLGSMQLGATVKGDNPLGKDLLVNQATSRDTSNEEEGPGCLPALMAAGALAAIVLFILCGVSTWFLFQQRTELAIKTLKGDVIPTVRESGMDPSEKADIVAVLTEVVEDCESGELEDWQASGIMERLYRAPLYQWGDLALLEAKILGSSNFTEAQKANAERQFSRLRRAVELNRAGSIDVNSVLGPVLEDAVRGQLPKLAAELNADDMLAAVNLAKQIADREEIPDSDFDVSMASIVRREVSAGRSSGGL